MKKKRAAKPPGGRLKGSDVFGLGTFFTLTDAESHFLTFVEFDTAETCVIDLTEVYENVFAAIFGLDESVAFFSIEPFDGSVDNICHEISFSMKFSEKKFEACFVR